MKGLLVGGLIAAAAVVLAVFMIVPSLLPSGIPGIDGGNDTDGEEMPRLENLSPSAGETVYGVNVSFRWTSDPDADSYSIIVTIPGNPIAALNLTSEAGHYDLDGSLTNGDYMWSVQAVEDGTYGPLSEATRFAVRTSLDAPILQSPSDGSVHVNTVPTLRWGAVSDALGYRLQIASDTSFNAILVDVRLDGTSYGPAFVMEDGAVYSWRVSGYHGEAWSPWSSVRQFSHDYFLAAPLPSSPVSSAVDGDQVNLTWSAVEGAERYRVEVSTASDFSVLNVSAEVSEYWYVVPSSLSGGSTYHWRVQAVSSVTASSWSAPVSFSVARDAIPFSYTWMYGGRSWTLDGSVPGSDYYYLSGLARTYDYQKYVMDSDPTVVSIATQLMSWSDSNGYDPASFILSFVQCLDYTTDMDTKGRVEYPRYPAETLVDGGGDCEDTSALYASLVESSAVNIDAVLLLFEYPEQAGHMAVGIQGPYSGQSYSYNYNDYYYCETTGEGFAVGQFPTDFPPGYIVAVVEC